MKSIAKFLNSIRDFLIGKKTYIVGLLFIIIGFIKEDNSIIMQGLAIIAIRAGIKNTFNQTIGKAK